jgi:cell division septation protein DedD
MTVLRKVFYSALLLGIGLSLGLVIGTVSPVPRLIRDFWSEPVQTVVVAPPADQTPGSAPLEAFRQLQEGIGRARTETRPSPLADVAAGSPDRSEPGEDRASQALERIAGKLRQEPGGYTGDVVQVAAYRDSRSAEALVRRLLREGFHAYVSQGHPGGDIRYRVRVWPSPDQKVAQLSSTLQQRGFSVWVTKE